MVDFFGKTDVSQGIPICFARYGHSIHILSLHNAYLQVSVTNLYHFTFSWYYFGLFGALVLTPGMAHSPQSFLLIATNCKMFLPETG